MNKNYLSFVLASLIVTGGLFNLSSAAESRDRLNELKDCKIAAKRGFRKVPDERNKRFLGKVTKETANCRGGSKAVKYRDLPWVDWPNYWAAGDASTKAPQRRNLTKIGGHLKPNGRGVDGALIDLEYQRVELIKFNLFDNLTFEHYIKGNNDSDGRAIKVWDEMRLPNDHPDYTNVGGDGKQLCQGELIRHRNVNGICNDIKNPLMGSTNTPFARNVEFESTYPEMGQTELARNRHGDRLALLKPDPQVISRKLFTRKQSNPELCNEGYGIPGSPEKAQCDYKKAPFFNVLAAFWIQFMNHDWFSHLVEGHNSPKMMQVGCTSQKVDNVETPLTKKDVDTLKCRPDDTMEAAYFAKTDEPAKFKHGGETRLSRAPKTTANTVTAWWDASQLYGYDETSRKRVKRDPSDMAKLLMEKRDDKAGQSYLPKFNTCVNASEDCVADPVNPAWTGQEATAFPDNWTIGLSFYHNVFAREHNLFVDEFRKRTKQSPNKDSGLRNPAYPDKIISYKQVGDDELFEAARLVIAAEIAKIHTIEWTTQLLYGEPMNLGMNSNWFGLLKDHKLVSAALDKVVHHGLAKSDEGKKSAGWYSVLSSGPGILGLGNDMDSRRLKPHKWDLSNPDDVNGGINHFGAPFNFPEEFITVYRLHTMLPDILEYRELENPNETKEKITVVSTFRGRATEAMDSRGLENWAVSMGRQRLGLLFLQNHPQFLQNLVMNRLKSSPTKKIDVVALDLIRDRERGIPRFNEFRRQYGLKQLTSFDDFIDQHLAADSNQRKNQQELVKLLREVYGQHQCDASKIISDAQLNDDGSKINDCLGHADGATVDNIEDLDTVVGWLAETTRPHGFAISETQFHVFILNASRRLFSDRFFTSSFRPEFYTSVGFDWVNDNGPTGKVMEKGKPNGHKQEVSLMKRILLRTMPELREELSSVVNVFDPWARDRGEYYTLDWKPRPDAKADQSFQ
ncbi:MAG: peroxidase family protein [Methylococcales bacterium]